MKRRCKYLNSCSFIVYGSHAAPFTTKMTRFKYCERLQDGCARYKAYQVMDAELVPHDLWPTLEIKTLDLIERRLSETQPHNRLRTIRADALKAD
jgi:hypothetical protein